MNMKNRILEKDSNGYKCLINLWNMQIKDYKDKKYIKLINKK